MLSFISRALALYINAANDFEEKAKIDWARFHVDTFIFSEF